MITYLDWHCPECGKTARTQPTPTRSATMHQCPKLRGLIAPMVRANVRASIVLHEREDYVKREAVQLDPERRRPVMSMETRYDDGHTDLVVYAPAATTQARS